MKARGVGLFVLLAGLCVTGCQKPTYSAVCKIEGPAHLVPEEVGRIQLGMLKSELESVLGEADYSPAEGQFYFSTGGDCPLDGMERQVSCGVVAEFRRSMEGAAGDFVLTDALQSCWWGAIGE